MCRCSRWARLLPALAVTFGALSAGCAGKTSQPATAVEVRDGGQHDASPPPSARAQLDPAPVPAPAAPPEAPLPGGDQPTPDKALPELQVEALGMHIGGGRNDADEKAPFHRALSRKFPDFLDCYRLAENPLAGGTFGIDLKIGRKGGNPVLEQPRTRIKGTAFRECMLTALSRTEFDRPKAGPTVLSYSVRFKWAK